MTLSNLNSLILIFVRSGLPLKPQPSKPLLALDNETMRWSYAAVSAALFLGASTEKAQAFGIHEPSNSFVSRTQSQSITHPAAGRLHAMTLRDPPTLSMSYKVGIAGATGAVGKEIRAVLENRKFPIDTLRIFGSQRSAGSKIETAYGTITVELFDVKSARECDVVFLAVSGEFSLEHARALTAGDDGCVCIDNSVRRGKRKSLQRLPFSIHSHLLFFCHCTIPLLSKINIPPFPFAG
jgi:hypothetical protein